MRRGIMGGMRFRNLRIAWSIFWGLLTLLLIVLWARSYWRVDIFRYGTKATIDQPFISVGFNRGAIHCIHWWGPAGLIEQSKPPGWSYDSQMPYYSGNPYLLRKKYFSMIR